MASFSAGLIVQVEKTRVPPGLSTCGHRADVPADVKEARIDDSSYAAEKARLQARMAYWTKESAHVKDQNALTADKRSNPYLNEQKAWLPWCPDSGCTGQ